MTNVTPATTRVLRIGLVALVCLIMLGIGLSMAKARREEQMRRMGIVQMCRMIVSMGASMPDRRGRPLPAATPSHETAEQMQRRVREAMRPPGPFATTSPAVEECIRQQDEMMRNLPLRRP